MKQLLIFGTILALCGCAAGGRDDVLVSKAALKACLAQHAQEVKACDGSLEAFQADLAVYQPMMASAVAAPPQIQMQPLPVSQQQSDFDSFAARQAEVAGGLDGVRLAIDIFRTEIDLVMGQIGCPSLDQLGPDFLWQDDYRRNR